VYLTGHVDGKPMSFHRKGDKVVLLEDDRQHDVDLIIEDQRGSEEPQIGVSALDEGLLKVAASIESKDTGKEQEHEISENDG